VTWIDGITYTVSNNSATFTLTNSKGCDSVVTLNLTINTVDTSVTSTDTSISASASGAQYQWLDCGNNYAIINGATERVFVPSANGSYAVEITQNGCTDTSVCTSILTIDISEITFFKSVKIYPNPNKGIVNVDLGNLSEVSIKVVSVGGQLIFYKENVHGPVLQFELQTDAGFYIIELVSKGEMQRYKLVMK
jgi:hypothetical protein